MARIRKPTCPVCGLRVKKAIVYEKASRVIYYEFDPETGEISSNYSDYVRTGREEAIVIFHSDDEFCRFEVPRGEKALSVLWGSIEKLS